MNEKLDALRLAHWLERDGATCQQHIDAAQELRRLHEANQELLEALIDCHRALELANFTQELVVVTAAIAKATGETQ